jgi:hypothetical protein
MKPITLWTVKSKITVKENDKDVTKVVWLFNHIEDGHCNNDKPTIKFDTQRGWNSNTWTKEFAHLDDNYKVIHNHENVHQG